jgi:cell division transport system permease protein
MKKRNDQSLGVARGKRVYDLPLNRASGAGFLMLLIALMTFLALLALASSFALSAMTDRWSSGLESKVTVEIPATDERGASLKHEEVRQKTEQIAAVLRQHPSVASVHPLSDQEITDLVKPWLGDNLQLAHVPMPGLISLQMRNEDQTTYKVLSDRVAAIEPRARVDTHEDWLRDVIRFTNALQFATALLTIVIGFTTATAMGGAVRARMAVNRDEIEILHLMASSSAIL